MTKHIDVDYSKLAQLGVRIKSRRIELRLTQAKVASDVGTHKNTIYEAERGNVNLSITYLYALANVLEISLVDLFEGIYINEKKEGINLNYYVRVKKDEKAGLKGFLEDLKLHGEVRAHLMPGIEVLREDYFNDMVNDREDEELEEGYVESFTKMTLEEIEARATN